jgi:lipopolysaccharide export LptBFGC system permease protein LptF
LEGMDKMNIIQLITQPFVMVYQLESIARVISPLFCILFNFIGIYFSIGIMYFNKPLIELVTFGILREKVRA